MIKRAPIQIQSRPLNVSDQSFKQIGTINTIIDSMHKYNKTKAKSLNA